MNYYAGQEVICISEDFPLIKKYGGTGKEAERTPKKGEILVIDEVLGEFLRFDKYDTNESNQWWKSDRFKPVVGNEYKFEDCISIPKDNWNNSGVKTERDD